MTLDERIDAAALVGMRSYEAKAGKAPMFRYREILSAAFPELFADPPTHKIVPIEPSADETDLDRRIREQNDLMKRKNRRMGQRSSF